MVVEFKNPKLGVIVPSIIIIYLHLSTTYIMHFDSRISRNSEYLVQLFAFLIYLSYYLAIKTPPGTPPKNFKPPSYPKYETEKLFTPLSPKNVQAEEEEEEEEDQLDEDKFQCQHDQYKKTWIKFCVKCQNYKPERTHHCKRCQKCVLKMDHHCPWTNNCIGYENTPHFVRFLFWVIVGVGYIFKFYFFKIYHLYESRKLPAYLFPLESITIWCLNLFLSFFILSTIIILFLRTIDELISNKTMIEDWELDRINDKFFDNDFWISIRKNYHLIHGGEHFPNLKTWKINYRILNKGTNVPLSFTFEDFVFPYDLGTSWLNLIDALGPIYFWLWPWGGPTGDGINFQLDSLNEDQLKLPFPPDGSDYDPINGKISKFERDEDNEQVVHSIVWKNYLGETLNDFGVDLDTELYKAD
ncbi:palmitoyltransferase [Martiniozyma asiatica (nom. inval.)]|nr:palmitoyltransferase [Martiniozyma asiatica]